MTKSWLTEEDRQHSEQFECFSREFLEAGFQVRFRARGASMSPAIRDGEVVYVRSTEASDLRSGDIVLVKSAYGFRLHRLIRADIKNDVFITRGDCGQQDDPAVTSDQVLGVAVAKEVRLGRGVVAARFNGPCGQLLRWAARGQFLFRKVLSGMWKQQKTARSAAEWVARSSTMLCAILVVGVATSGFGQVIFQGASAPATGTLTTGTNTVTVTQTIPTQTNGLLVICISMNNQQSPTSTVTSITDNGSATGIFNVGTVNTSPIKSRVEIWALKTPPTGLNTIVITIPVTAPTVGVVAASADFSSVNQTTPFETFGSATGSGNGSSPTVTVTSAAGEVVIDTVAAASPVVLTAGTGQVQEWQASSGASTRDTEGAGSIKQGSAPTATMTWTHTGPTSWAIGAVSIRPSVVTSVAMRKFEAHSSSSGTLLRWQVGRESHNLGFNVYEEQGGGRVRLNPSLIAGSALLMSGALPQHSGKTYSWIDSSPNAGRGSYWIEDVDVNGTRTMHGPVSSAALASGPVSGEALPASSPMFSQLKQVQPSAMSGAGGHLRESVLEDFKPTEAQRTKQFELAAQPAVKIFVKHEGWHRITQPDLIQAGLDPNVDPALLHLYAEAVEQPILITGAGAGAGGFGPQATLQFYGMGIDTQYSGTRVYWLVAEPAPGERIHQLPASTGSNQPVASFRATVEVAPRTTYFPALITSDGNNFFGPLISSTATDQTVNAPHVDKNSSEPARLEVILQGIVVGSAHDVAIAINGTSLGNVTFTGQEKGKFQVTLPPGLLQDGDNTVTLTAQGGQYDTSLLQSIRLEYPHFYKADSDYLRFSGRTGDEVKVGGFTSSDIVAFDVTAPDRPVELTPQIVADGSAGNRYSLQVQVPWSSSNPGEARHTLIAVASDRYLSAVGVRPNHPSHWHQAQAGNEIVMVSHGDLADALPPLVQAHRAEGQSAAVVLIDDLYDEFNFGERSPDVIREFLRTATKVWQTAPHYLLLNGRASIDPRNYLGFGHLDLVPTKIVPTVGLMTASDDWFSDFTDSGAATIATGRFPVTTPSEAALVAGKVATYEGQSTNGPWMSQALMVADVNDTENFAQDSEIVQAQLPSLQITDVFATTSNIAASKEQIVSSINTGQVLVNYIGHGSEEQWSGDDLLDNNVAAGLTNGSSLPVFLIMNCLNGLFQDVSQEPLGVTLMLVPNGGAVAVLASSGLNEATPQTTLDKLIVQNAMHDPHPALGDAIVQAKSAISDVGVRKTFNLLGDPAMRIKPMNSNASH